MCNYIHKIHSCVIRVQLYQRHRQTDGGMTRVSVFLITAGPTDKRNQPNSTHPRARDSIVTAGGVEDILIELRRCRRYSAVTHTDAQLFCVLSTQNHRHIMSMTEILKCSQFTGDTWFTSSYVRKISGCLLQRESLHGRSCPVEFWGCVRRVQYIGLRL